MQGSALRHYFLAFTVAGSLLAFQAEADNTGLSLVSSLSVGASWAKGGETQALYLTPGIEKKYVADKTSNVLASGELFIGVQNDLSRRWTSYVGIAAATTDNAKLQGIIWDDADPQFDNYSYKYKIKNTRVALKGTLLFEHDYGIVPWVSASVGVGFNKAHGFSNTPLIYQALPSGNFEDNTETAFTYTIGAGIQKIINKHWQIGLGYEFADWGKSKLKRMPAQTLNSGLKLDHLYTNGILLNFTYLK